MSEIMFVYPGACGLSFSARNSPEEIYSSHSPQKFLLPSDKPSLKIFSPISTGSLISSVKIIFILTLGLQVSVYNGKHDGF